MTERDTSLEIHLDLTLTPEMAAVLDQLRKDRGESLAAVFRAAIALLRTAQDAKQRGEELVLTKGGVVLGRLLGI